MKLDLKSAKFLDVSSLDVLSKIASIGLVLLDDAATESVCKSVCILGESTGETKPTHTEAEESL